MTCVVAAVLLLIVSGLAALAAGRSHWSTRFAVAGAVGAAVVGLPAAASSLVQQPSLLRLPWSMPLGTLSLRLDALSGLFLLPILALPAIAAVYGARYMESHSHGRSLGAHWFFYNCLVAGMAVTVVAANGLVFLVAWEAMSLASFFLVTFENERPEVREGGWTYLVATHFGTAFLVAMFVILAAGAGSLDFDRLPAGGLAGRAAMFFLFAVIGFGTKAGFMPFHVWLPEAHPAAPSHVSAVMSGVMIKVGIYGLVRMLVILGPAPAWWGWTLVAIGATSGILGVLFALAQHDLKRLLAYHSVENIGIIALGLGVGLLGTSFGSPALAVLGFGGALLHVVNHATFKGLLFLTAGAVQSAAHTREIDHLGGLLKRMPWTGTTFLVGAIAISGLPPLNGFASEFLIYLGALRGAEGMPPAAAVPGAAVIAALALIGGLAAACFTKAFGIVFLGEPRSEHAAGAREVAGSMRASMFVLAALCAAIGLLSPTVVSAIAPAAAICARTSADAARIEALAAAGPLSMVVVASAILAALACAFALLRRRLLARREVTETVTWDCGYARPTARMQYTASSFAQPIVELFRMVLRTRRRLDAPEGLFPTHASFSNETRDLCREHLYAPAFSWVGRALSGLQRLQQGSIHVYVLYIVLTLIALLVWRLR